MSQPELTVTGQEIYDALAPLAQSPTPGMSDAENGYAMAILSGGLASMVDQVSAIVREQPDGTPGYGILFNPDALAANGMGEWLPWVAQFLGDSQAVQSMASLEDQVNLVKNPRNFYRGRPATIISAAQSTLTGTRKVILNQFRGSDANQLGVTTFTDDTPDPQATQDAVMSVMPAWLKVTFATVTGGTYATLAGSHSTYSEMEAAHSSYADILANPAA